MATRTGAALVVGVDMYQQFDGTGGHDLKFALASANAYAKTLFDAGYHATQLDGVISTAAFRTALHDFAQHAAHLQATTVDPYVPVVAFFGCGVTLPNGLLALAFSDTGPDLSLVLLLDEMWSLFYRCGPEELTVILDCGFTGKDRPSWRSRTLTPEGRPNVDRPLFPWRFHVLAHPVLEPVEDEMHVVEFPQFDAGMGGDLFTGTGEWLGEVRTDAVTPFAPDIEYWWFQRTPWPQMFELRDRVCETGMAGVPLEPEDWIAYPRVSFEQERVAVKAPPSGTTIYLLARRDLAGEITTIGVMLLERGPGDEVGAQTWYAYPREVRSDLLHRNRGEALLFTEISSAAIPRREMRRARTSRTTG